MDFPAVNLTFIEIGQFRSISDSFFSSAVQFDIHLHVILMIHWRNICQMHQVTLCINAIDFDGPKGINMVLFHLSSYEPT